MLNESNNQFEVIDPGVVSFQKRENQLSSILSFIQREYPQVTRELVLSHEPIDRLEAILAFRDHNVPMSDLAFKQYEKIRPILLTKNLELSLKAFLQTQPTPSDVTLLKRLSGSPEINLAVMRLAVQNVQSAERLLEILTPGLPAPSPEYLALLLR